jgi:hypothetical protein
MQALVRRSHQIVEVGSFGVVESEGTADSFEHRFRDALRIAAFETGVVLDAHAGEQSHFFPPEPGDATAPAEVRQPGLLWSEPGPSAGQELPNVVRSVHDQNLRHPPKVREALALTG